MKELFKRFKLWFTRGKHCRCCCLFCEYFDCCYAANAIEHDWIDAKWERVFDDNGQK